MGAMVGALVVASSSVNSETLQLVVLNVSLLMLESLLKVRVRLRFAHSGFVVVDVVDVDVVDVEVVVYMVDTKAGCVTNKPSPRINWFNEPSSIGDALEPRADAGNDPVSSFTWKFIFGSAMTRSLEEGKSPLRS
jgi:hypothetical protein